MALAAVAILALAGCTTAPQSKPVEVTTQVAPEPEPVPAPRPSPTPVQAPVAKAPPAPSQATPQADEPVPASPIVANGRLTIHIESSPSGAMILVDGMPVGRAPIDIMVDTNGSGFFKAPVTIRARFVAGETGGESFSVDERLGQLERVPQALVFSHDGAQRILRQF